MRERSLPVLHTTSAAGAATRCQLELAPVFTSDLRTDERIRYTLEHHGRRLMRRAVRVLTSPGVIWRKLGLRPVADRAVGTPRAVVAPPPTKALEPGELVRVRRPEEIAATLDAASTCEGMAYLGIVMDRFAGKTFRVHRRIDYFFDERRWKMLKARNTVILDGVFCEPAIDAGVPWAGCSRSCFLFWKEAWLERVEPDARST